MNPLYFLFENFRTATEGFNVLAKIIIASVLLFIILASVFAILGVILAFIG